jgi:hypothetical protein
MKKAACKGHLGPGYEAAWLTPLLTEREAAEPLLSYPAYEFVVIGSSDPYLSLPCPRASLSARAGRATWSGTIPSWATTSPRCPTGTQSDKEPQPRAGQPP